MSVISYEGPPLWILSDDLALKIADLPEDGKGWLRARFTMRDGVSVTAVVAYDRIVELPAPYTSRDIATVRKAR